MMHHTKMMWFNASSLRVSKKIVIFAAKKVILTVDCNLAQQKFMGVGFCLVAQSVSMDFLETLILNRYLR